MQSKTCFRRFSWLALTWILLGSLSGCAFSQWTEFYFFGSPGKRPVYDNRVVTGVVILPFALVTDLVTFPIQGIILAIKGDDFLYKRQSLTSGPSVSSGGYSMQSRLQPNPWSQVNPAQQERIQLHAGEVIEALDRAGGEGPSVFEIRADGSLAALRLDQDAIDQLRSRAGSEHVYARASLPTACRDPFSRQLPVATSR